MYIIGYRDQNDKVLLKILKLFKMILKKKFINFFQKFGGWVGEGPVMVRQFCSVVMIDCIRTVKYMLY